MISAHVAADSHKVGESLESIYPGHEPRPLGRSQLVARFFREPIDKRVGLAALLLRGFLYYPQFNRKYLVLTGPHLHVERRFGEIHLGQLVSFGSPVTVAAVGPDRERSALVEIGAYTFLEDRTHINCEQKVTIGTQCAISWDVDILDTNSHTVISIEVEPLTRWAPVIIEDRGLGLGHIALS